MQFNLLLVLLAFLAANAMATVTSAPSFAPTVMPTMQPTGSPTAIPCSAFNTNKKKCKENPACGWRGWRQCALVCKYKDEASCTGDYRCTWKADPEEEDGGSCKVGARTPPGKGKGKGKGKGL